MPRYRPTKRQKEHFKKHGYMLNTMKQKRTIGKHINTSRTYIFSINKRTGVSTALQGNTIIRISPRGKLISIKHR